MRLLLIHADHFEYEVKNEAVKEPEPVLESNRKDVMDDVLVAFCTVEKADEKNPDQIAAKAAESIKEVAGWVKTKSIMVYPYAHLSSNLGSKEYAIPLLQRLGSSLQDEGYNVKRSPFGWYKSFEIRCKGHPLSELSRTIVIEEATKEAVPVKTEYKILSLDGKIYEPDAYPFKPNEKEFKALVEKEALKIGLAGGEPRLIDYCKKFGIEWEPYSDVGHMRYGPEATLIFELIGDYSWQVANSFGIPVLQVRGTNMFDLSVKAVKEHANLFGARLYEVKVDEKAFVMRYAACHQQFAMVKDWALSYRNVPFGTFEVADSYRLEQSGELLLCFRVRKLHMPDLHIYCKNLDEAKEMSMKVHKKIYQEIRKLDRDYVSIYNTTKSFFEKHREFFDELIKVERKPILLNFVPDGIYYWVINVEYTVIDELERPREIATFQIDMGNAERFGIAYTDRDGAKRCPPIIHTALLGTVERYLFTVLDKASKMEERGKKPMLPVWLSPVQVRIIPIKKRQIPLAKKLLAELERASIRVDVDDREESLSKRIRDAEISWIPYILVLGEREMRSKKFPVRVRAKDGQIKMNIKTLTQAISKETAGYSYRALTIPRLVSERPGYKAI